MRAGVRGAVNTLTRACSGDVRGQVVPRYWFNAAFVGAIQRRHGACCEVGGKDGRVDSEVAVRALDK